MVSSPQTRLCLFSVLISLSGCAAKNVSAPGAPSSAAETVAGAQAFSTMAAVPAHRQEQRDDLERLATLWRKRKHVDHTLDYPLDAGAVVIEGGIAKPGAYKIASGMTVLTALARA